MKGTKLTRKTLTKKHRGRVELFQKAIKNRNALRAALATYREKERAFRKKYGLPEIEEVKK